MTSKYTCSMCSVVITKENGAQAGCPACGYLWTSVGSKDTLPIEPWGTYPWPYEYPTTIPFPLQSPWIITYGDATVSSSTVSITNGKEIKFS